MVSLVLVSHSLPLAASIANLIQHIVKEDVNIAIAAGVDDPEHPWGTDVIKIQQAIKSVYSDDGVVVLMDLGSAVLSAEMAIKFLNPEQQTALFKNGGFWVTNTGEIKPSLNLADRTEATQLDGFTQFTAIFA